MTIAIGEEHQEVARTTRAFLDGHQARAAGRELLAAPPTAVPQFWKELAELGLLGLHLPEEFGGGGGGLPELVVVVEELGRAVAPGPFLPTMAASAVIAAQGGPDLRARLLPGLAGGVTVAALGLGGALARDGDTLSGDAGAVLGGALAEVVLLAVGDDVVVVSTAAPGVAIEVPSSNLDRSRPSARLRLDGVPVTPDAILVGARSYAEAVLRTLVAAEAVGGAHECVTAATEYAKVREQFGRTIGSFQAVKHHLANMLVAAELGTAAAWDAARAAAGPRDEFALAAAVAAALAVPAFVDNAERNIQLHGGIGFTWEHDAHLLQRRSLALKALFPPFAAAADVTRLGLAGVARTTALDLPPEAEAARPAVRELAAQLSALPVAEQRRRLIETGYVQPHWPKPWGIEAPAGLQLVIEEEFRAAGVGRVNLSITGWVILTLVQHGSAGQVDRWVRPALAGEEIWCQLFSEPGAGSDAAAVRTSATRADGGWVVSGQKVWTSDAHLSRWGLATVRTDPAAGKHDGITTMVIDMSAPGVEVRPLRQSTGDSMFNEVFLTDVFVPDADVVGAPGAGWAVARATLGNERVSLGGSVDMMGSVDLFGMYREHGHRLPGAEARIGAHLAENLALRQLNLRRAERAVAGGGPGPEGNITKLVVAEHAQRTATLASELAGEQTAFTDTLGGVGWRLLISRAATIAGGTSEIARNQIAERILGLPRDPLAR
ncbi:acyl-CoA dehydrogenase [Frankia sp. CNm7]|uniref:Acyl-CoA dehydrogenase n=1 Tax=Frankia nepalensis TaxID=1836974 RepID=A0A937UVG4_9ACTN|nr:acyl-CoA dehydrogenase [Frankia nepalensis]MBL7498690.1 acyl-CoA dehydrogenase [Frankia nepalensis]MBL7512912.1 acyl-CoA dehydrogenase [Frankia nepalensis]MBL7521646.1 acyl-CoA dehydrogenase [Frankia nepalensis]MBL7633225.1 acyl-CoA dehydrogenase [Frankia nepalensis]